MFVVIWYWNQGDVSWRIGLVGTENGSVNGFLCVCLVDWKDFWISMGRSRVYVMSRWLALGSLVLLGAVQELWLST